ncbi:MULTISPECIES: DUF6683 family protein [unclassified Duganella]|uniref:DUF6683 family protein n=1 Tax=unclassified Duganella TaxID=2636909 RepID=UPI0006FDF400|nr:MULTISPECIES: DUF6683 family protein [unclassified Duganella]KQV54516.1 hypothetical protein ASD07_08340 [Duganella sp. Root336D2]KRC03641.1 hypothetical protein ASE26_02065 [Duganella sp. Root198D2]
MKCKLILGVLATALAPAAQSQCCGYGMSYDNVVVWPQPDLRIPVPSAANAKKAPPILPKSKPAVQANAHKLAQHFAADKRAEMEKVYVQSMDVYLQVEKKMGWTPRDMAGGLAAFLVGNYMVLKNTEVSDEDFNAVARQIRAQDRLQNINDRNEADKVRDVFEQSAMIGAFMALAYKSHQQQPQPPVVHENMRNAARENLQLVLKGDPGNLSIDKNGMRFQ